MRPSSWERGGGIAGIAAVVVDLAGVVIGGRGIAIDSQPQALVDRYVELGIRPAVHAMCISIAMVLLLWFVSALRALLVANGADRSLVAVFYGSALGVFAIEFVRATVLATLSLRAGDLGPEVVTGLYVISQVIGPISAVPLAAGLLALAAIARDNDVLPRWVGVWSLVVAAVWLISTVRLLTTSTSAWSASIAAFVAYAAGVIVIGMALAKGRLGAPALQQ